MILYLSYKELHLNFIDSCVVVIMRFEQVFWFLDISQFDFGERLAVIVHPELRHLSVVSMTLPGLAGDKGLNGNADHEQDE